MHRERRDPVSYVDEKPVAEVNAGAQDAPDAEDAQDAQDTPGFRRTGTHAAVLDGTAFTLLPAPGDDAGALLDVLRLAAPAALVEAGIDTADALRERLVRGVGDGEVPTVLVPQPTGGRSLSVERLEGLGVLLDNSQRAQGILLGGDLPLADLTPVQRLQVLLGDSSYADAETRLYALLAIAVRLFDAHVAMVDSEERSRCSAIPRGARRPSSSFPTVTAVSSGIRASRRTTTAPDPRTTLRTRPENKNNPENRGEFVPCPLSPNRSPVRPADPPRPKSGDGR